MPMSFFQLAHCPSCETDRLISSVTAFLTSVLLLTSRTTVNPKRFRSQGKTTPFEGWKLRGRPVATFLAGRRVGG